MPNKKRSRGDQQEHRRLNAGLERGADNSANQRQDDDLSRKGDSGNQGNNQSRQGDGGNRGKRGNRGLG